MGGGFYSHDFEEEIKARHKATGADPYKYTASVRSGTAARAIHPTLDPRGTTRESRDSADHPRSVPIALALDETGSMEAVCRSILDNLGTSIDVILKKGYLPDPQVCPCAFGDARCGEAAPVQVGQFESDNRIRDHFANVLIENGGGGQRPPSESVAQLAWFLAHRTRHDAYEKRGRPGYAFFFTDEQAYSMSSDECELLFGVRCEGVQTPEMIFAELRKLYTPFVVIPRDASNGRDPQVENYWVKLVGREYVIMLDDSGAAAETVAAVIGMNEGTVDEAGLAADLASAGVSTALVPVVQSAVSHLAGRGLARTSGGGKLAPGKGKSGTERL